MFSICNISLSFFPITKMSSYGQLLIGFFGKCKVCNVGDLSRGWLKKNSLFNSYCIKVSGRALLHFTLDSPFLCWMLSKGTSSTTLFFFFFFFFFFFYMTLPAIEPWSRGPLANTQLIWPMARFIMYLFIKQKTK